MKNGEPCTSKGVSAVLEGVTPRPPMKHRYGAALPTL